MSWRLHGKPQLQTRIVRGREIRDSFVKQVAGDIYVSGAGFEPLGNEVLLWLVDSSMRLAQLLHSQCMEGGGNMKRRLSLSKELTSFSALMTAFMKKIEVDGSLGRNALQS
jgi:hypothetical protein